MSERECKEKKILELIKNCDDKKVDYLYELLMQLFKEQD